LFLHNLVSWASGLRSSKEPGWIDIRATGPDFHRKTQIQWPTRDCLVPQSMTSKIMKLEIKSETHEFRTEVRP
jgi:hypothetical protein